MKLQKRLARHGKNKDYYKWVFNIPSEVIDEIGWDKLAGKDFECKISGKKLVIERE